MIGIANQPSTALTLSTLSISQAGAPPQNGHSTSTNLPGASGNLTHSSAGFPSAASTDTVIAAPHVSSSVILQPPATPPSASTNPAQISPSFQPVTSSNTFAASASVPFGSGHQSTTQGIPNSQLESSSIVLLHSGTQPKPVITQQPGSNSAPSPNPAVATSKTTFLPSTSSTTMTAPPRSNSVPQNAPSQRRRLQQRWLLPLPLPAI